MPWRLLWRNLLGHPVRSLLTFGSVAVAVFLVSMLHAVSAVLEVPVHGAAQVELVLEPRTGSDRIAGIVLDPVGEPVSGAGLAAMRHSKLGEQWVDGPTTGADGRFSVAVLDGYPYFVMAEIVGQPSDAVRVRNSSTVPVPDRASGPITLTIPRR